MNDDTAATAPVRLPNGRALDLYVSGPSDGGVLIYHHGAPSSCRPVRAIERAAHRLGLRFVSTSRAGYGDSSRLPGRSVVHAAADTAAVLDLLGATSCVVAGWSGGGPHALACGARLADRVAAVLVIAGLAPFDGAGLDFLAGMGEDNVVSFGKAIQGEQALRPHLEALRAGLLQATPDNMAAGLASLLPPVDRTVLTGELAVDMTTGMHEALRSSVDGWLDDALAFVQPWGFALSEVTVPTLLWHGSEDKMVPFAHGTWLAQHIPRVVAHLEQGEGHLSIGIGAIDRMLSELLAAARLFA